MPISVTRRHRLRTLAVRALAAALLSMTSAHAQPAGVGARLDTYEAGSARDQLDVDVTPIPVGMGALMVQSLTDASLEPPVLVYLGDERVARGRTGERIVVPPGEYRVVVGHGPLDRRASTRVRVVEGMAVPTPPFVGAIRITAVDHDGRPVEVDYRLTAAESGDLIGEGQTTTRSEYGATPTWLVGPDAVELTIGDEVDAGRQGVALVAAPGRVARYRLVLDRGRLVRSEFAVRETVPVERRWRTRWIIGADASFTRASGRLGAVDGDFIRAGLFTRAELGYDRGPHLAVARLDLEESWLGLTDRPGAELDARKFEDELRVETLYNYRPRRIIGPYVRGELRTALFETERRFSEDVTVTVRDGDTTEQRVVAAGEPIAMFDAMRPLDLRAGAGVGLTAVDNDTLTLTARVGAGARRARYDGGLAVIDDAPGALTLVRLEDDDSVGLEAAARFEVRATPVITVGVDGGLYIPWSQLEGEVDRPLFRVDGTVAFDLARFAAVVLDTSLRREAYEVGPLQLSTHLSLRIQHTLL